MQDPAATANSLEVPVGSAGTGDRAVLERRVADLRRLFNAMDPPYDRLGDVDVSLIAAQLAERSS